MWESFQNIFSTREIALIAWFILILGSLITRKNVKKSLVPLFKSFFHWKIQLVIALLLTYSVAEVLLLKSLGIWSKSLIKDMVFWFCGFAFITLLRLDKVNEVAFFKYILKDAIKWTLIIEFVVNFYTFSLLTELLITPFIFIIVLLQAYASVYKEYKKVETLMNWVMIVIGTIFLYHAFRETVNSYEKLLTLMNLKSFLFPPLMSILVLPFFYGLALFMKYEELFIRVNFLTTDKNRNAILKMAILRHSRLNINRLQYVSTNLNKLSYYNAPSANEYLRQLFALPKG